jgi:hypothetical protein
MSRLNPPYYAALIRATITASLEMVFFEWIRKAGTPEFKELSKEFLV